MFSARKDREKKLLEFAVEMEGYFTAKQALRAGYSYRLQHYHKSEGNWQEIDRGVYRLTHYPHSPFEDLIRWALWSRNREDIPQAVFSHETALSIHELGDVMPGQTHITVPPGFRKRSPGGCVVHKAALRTQEIESRVGFSVTSPLRTIQDVAEGPLEVDQLEKAIRDGINKGALPIGNIQNLQFSKKAKEKIRLMLDEIKKHPLF